MPVTEQPAQASPQRIMSGRQSAGTCHREQPQWAWMRRRDAFIRCAGTPDDDRVWPIALRVTENHCSHSGGDWGSRSACSSSPRHERRDRSGTVRQSQDGQRPRLEHSPRTWSVEPPRGSRPGGEPANLRSVPRSREISASVAHRASKCRQSAHQIVSVTADALHSPRSPADHPLSRRSIAGPPPAPHPGSPRRSYYGSARPDAVTRSQP